jgi:hypothetical protein
MHEALHPHTHAPIRDRTLWFCVGAGVVVWSLHFFLSYVLVDQVCRNNWFNFKAAGISGLQWAITVLTVAGVAIVGAAALSSYRAWRELNDKDTRSLVEDRYRFMMFSGMALSITFIVLMVVNYVPTFMLPPCR